MAYSPSGDLLAVGDSNREVSVFERGSWNARIQVRIDTCLGQSCGLCVSSLVIWSGLAFTISLYVSLIG